MKFTQAHLVKICWRHLLHCVCGEKLCKLSPTLFSHAELLRCTVRSAHLQGTFMCYSACVAHVSSICTIPYVSSLSLRIVSCLFLIVRDMQNMCLLFIKVWRSIEAKIAILTRVHTCENDMVFCFALQMNSHRTEFSFEDIQSACRPAVKKRVVLSSLKLINKQVN